MVLISFPIGVLFLRNKRVGFFQQFSKPKTPLEKCLCAYIIIYSREGEGCGVEKGKWGGISFPFVV